MGTMIKVMAVLTRNILSSDWQQLNCQSKDVDDDDDKENDDDDGSEGDDDKRLMSCSPKWQQLNC